MSTLTYKTLVITGLIRETKPALDNDYSLVMKVFDFADDLFPENTTKLSGSNNLCFFSVTPDGAVDSKEIQLVKEKMDKLINYIDVLETEREKEKKHRVISYTEMEYTDINNTREVNILRTK